MTTLQDYLNEKYPTKEEKSKVKEIDVRKIGKIEIEERIPRKEITVPKVLSIDENREQLANFFQALLERKKRMSLTRKRKRKMRKG